MNVLCFGEPLIRLATSAHERLEIARDLEISYAGAETVVAISLALQGESVSYATKLASNRLGTNALMTLARYGVDTSRVIRSNDRMGLFYTERGRSIRSTIVTYDRSGTAMANASHEDFDWDRMLNGVEVFFFSGVIPAISDEMTTACLEGLRACRGRGIRTVCDLNYRNTLWSRDKAQRAWGKLIPLLDVLIASEDDIISIDDAQVSGDDVFDYCLNWSRGLMLDYPLESVCFLARSMDRYDAASFRGGLVNREGTFNSKTEVVSVSDISSCGSIFSAGIVHGENSRWDPQFMIDYATMASAFKATVAGDLSFASETEIASLLAESVRPYFRQ